MGGGHIHSPLACRPLPLSGKKSGMGTIHSKVESLLYTCFVVVYITGASPKGSAHNPLVIGCDTTMSRAVTSVVANWVATPRARTATYMLSCYTCCYSTWTVVQLIIALGQGNLPYTPPIDSSATMTLSGTAVFLTG